MKAFLYSSVDDIGTEITNFSGIAEMTNQLPTYISMHGWQGNEKSEMHRILHKAWMENKQCQVIAITWERADTLLYPVARFAVKAVGLEVSTIAAHSLG